MAEWRRRFPLFRKTGAPVLELSTGQIDAVSPVQ
jgi:hypothetical protein